MASILNTDLGDLYSQWGERVAFNEGYQKQKISSAREAGANAFNDGLDSSVARDNYFASQKQKSADAQEFLNSENVSSENVEVEDVGEVMDGEETLGMESVVSGETEDLISDDEGGYSGSIFNRSSEHYEDKMMEVEFEMGFVGNKSIY